MSATSTNNRRERREEKDRISEILAMGKRFRFESAAAQFIEADKSIEAFRAHVLENQSRFIPVKDSPPIADSPPPGALSADLGLSERDVKGYDLSAAINGLINGSDRGAEKEFAMSFELGKLNNSQARGLFIPNEVVFRALTAGPGGTGQYIIGQDYRPDLMAEALRNTSVLATMGARLETGLQGNVSIPRVGTGSAVGWVGEAENVSDTALALNSVEMTPHTVGAYSDLTRKMLLQAQPDATQFVIADLMGAIGEEIDRVGFHGAGSDNEPVGLADDPDLTVVSLGVNGDAITYGALVDLMTSLGTANTAGLGREAFVMRPSTAGAALQLPKVASTDSVMTLESADEFLGKPIHLTNSISNSLTKAGGSNLSAVFYGNWAEFVMGFWGQLDVNVDTATLSRSGGVRLVAMQDIDVAARRGNAFAAILDSTS